MAVTVAAVVAVVVVAVIVITSSIRALFLSLWTQVDVFNVGSSAWIGLTPDDVNGQLVYERVTIQSFPHTIRFWSCGSLIHVRCNPNTSFSI